MDAAEGAVVGEESLPREPWSNATGRYVGNVLSVFGMSSILNILLGQMMTPQPWGAVVAFALLMGGFFASGDKGTPDGPFRRRGVALLALAALAAYLGGGWLMHRNGWLPPAPSELVEVATGVASVAVGLLVSGRFERQVRVRDSSSTPSRVRPSAGID